MDDATVVRPDVAVRALGLTVLSNGWAAPIADIVLIHGLQGHPQETWQFRATAQAKPKGNLRNLFRRRPKPASGEDENDCAPNTVFWPVDLLSTDFQNARILTYGYDSRVSHFFSGPTNQNNISAHGRSLLNALELYRREFPKRPILFIVHSLGGIILKEALRRSRKAGHDDQDLRNVYESTHAIIFFGTPHRGSAYANVGIVAQDIVKVVGFDANAELLRNLKPDGAHLEILREEFSDMLEERAFKVYSFQEALGFKGVNVLSRKIVDDASSSLDHSQERKDSINANHIMMCRFTGREDDGYIKVSGVLEKYMEEIQKMKKQEQQKLDMQQKKLRKIILASLKTASMRAREKQIDHAHSHTFEWVFNNPAAGFQDWMESDGGIFWIKGKPGSGKSTLMKYILDNKRTRQALSSRGRTILSMPSFFFHDRGAHETQKSFDGLLRSIIYQLLCDIPALTSAIVNIYFQMIENEYQSDWPAAELEQPLHAILQQQKVGSAVWPTADLEKALNAILEQQKVEGCVCLFIDALDEYKGKADWITRFLKSLATPASNQKLTVRICASSREWNVFGLLLSENPHLTLQDLTADDIKSFASQKLDEAKRDGSDELLEEIIRRAEGVFLWVKLVIDELLEPLINGEPIRNLISSLSDMPDELPRFYERMLSQIPKRDHETAISMIELTLASGLNGSGHNGLSLPLFCLAVDLLRPDSCLPKDLSLAPAETEKRCKEMQRRIKASSGGLLEVPSSSPSSHVQFVHQTAKSFVQDATDRTPFDGKTSMDLVFNGIERAMRLHILLLGQMDATLKYKPFTSWSPERQPKCPTEYPLFDYSLMIDFGLWARASHLLPRVTSQAVVDDFRRAIVTHCGPHWVETYWSTYDPRRHTLYYYKSTEGSLAPTSFLDFAVQYGLLLIAEREIKENKHKYSNDMDGAKLLYYTVVGNGRSSLPDIDRSTRSCEMWQGLAKVFLEHSCDPNGLLTVDVAYDKQFLMNGSTPPLSDRYQTKREFREAEMKDITPLHLALAIACSYDNVDELGRIDRLKMLRLLVEHGADATLSYRNHWTARAGEAEVRTAVHYLLYTAPSEKSPFDDPDVGCALSECIITFFDNGLEPNALDSDGASILECAFPFCSAEFIETLLQKGAKITPKLLDETGKPLPGAGGILDSSKWRKPEFYTAEARDLARRYNEDWANLEKLQKQESQGGILQSTKGIFLPATAILGGFRSWLGKAE